MPDISMCQNKECPLSKTCYRFLAEPDPYWQAYAGFQPDKNGKCEGYWPVNSKSQLKRLNFQTGGKP